MKHIKAKFGAYIASGALIFSIAPGVFAASQVDVTVSGNGAGSTQHITVNNSFEETMHQSNTTTVMSIQNAKASTGENAVTGSTGGEHIITTGDASAKNSLSVMSGGNAVVADPCACESSSTVVHVLGNGADSKTKVKVSRTSKKNVKQKTNTSVYNEQDAKTKTGKNKIKNSTGSDNMIQTGGAKTENTTVVESGSNIIAQHMSME